MGNALGTTDILKLLGAGITVGLGTDGYTNDMLESYKVANCLVKHEQHKPYVGWGEVPHMLFENNRKMANEFFDTTVGILKKGAAADVIVLDYAAPVSYTHLDVYKRQTRSRTFSGEIWATHE